MISMHGDYAEIAALRSALAVAENAFDADAVTAHLTEDAVFMVPDYPVQEGRDACAAFMREAMGWLSAHVDRHIEYVSHEVVVLGDLGFDRGTFSFTVSPKSGGDRSQVTGKYFWLLRRESGAWRVARLAVVQDGDAEEVSAN